MWTDQMRIDLMSSDPIDKCKYALSEPNGSPEQ